MLGPERTISIELGVWMGVNGSRIENGTCECFPVMHYSFRLIFITLCKLISNNSYTLEPHVVPRVPQLQLLPCIELQIKFHVAIPLFVITAFSWYRFFERFLFPDISMLNEDTFHSEFMYPSSSSVKCLWLWRRWHITVCERRFCLWSLCGHDSIKPGNLTARTRFCEAAHSHCSRQLSTKGQVQCVTSRTVENCCFHISVCVRISPTRYWAVNLLVCRNFGQSQTSCFLLPVFMLS